MNRRDFLSAAGLATACGLFSSSASASAALTGATPPQRRLGLQLYTVMPALSRDFEGTIKAIAEIGYKEVETIGSFGRDPTELKLLLEKYGLTSPSQHIVSDELYRVFDLWVKREISIEERNKAFLHAFDLDRIEETIPEAILCAKSLGQRYVIWQAIFENQIASRADVDKLIRAFNRAGELCSAAGLEFAFHNHALELEKIDGCSVYDRILSETDPTKVKMQMDFYWMKKAEADWAAYLANNPGRYKLCHLKDMDQRGNVIAPGSGALITKQLIELAGAAGIEHFIVENDSSAIPFSPERHAFSYMSEVL